ncbi:MAG: helix-turn-helix transcriptional regulator [Bacilli bacterium]|nr:helix-turn-helix transcriptional regulator [Bacilli bacterium]
MNNSSIVVYVEYGSIHFDIKTMMKKRKMTKTQLAKRTGLHHQIIDRYYNNNVTRYDKDVLAKLCFILDCSLSDILYYEKPKKN